MPLRVTLVALACAFMLALAAPFALADADGKGRGGEGGPPGDNGTVKVHRAGTPDDKPSNQPHVCEFYLAAFQFDGAQKISWEIQSWPPTGNREVVKTGSLTLNDDGRGRTEDMTLPDGHYKLFWTFEGEHGKAKHKVFWVKCIKATESPSPTPSESSPSESPSPSETPSNPGPSETPAAPVPSAVQTNLPVTG